LLVLSVAVGTFLSLLVGRKILEPITRFSEATQEVAGGNFTIRMQEESHIPEIRDMSRLFNRMIEELAGIETFRTDFIVNVSHEFRTPISAIEGYATLLQDHTIPAAERDEYVRMIIESARQLSTLSGNILRLSKLENQDEAADRETYRLDEQIRNVILSLEQAWSAKNIDLNLSLPGVMYDGSRELLFQVWYNLIENAVKYTPHGGQIDILLLEDDHMVTVKVADSGDGMDAQTMKHIFKKFYQADSARKAEGNGLGLAIVKSIVDLCGGEVSVLSEQGKGSTFSVLLPK